jgi:hypothetical protein
MADSRFVSVDIDSFIEENNNNTKRKTKTCLSLFKQFLQEVQNTDEDVETIEPRRLDLNMSEFFAAARKADSSKYEPLSLRSIFASFYCYLKEKHYPEQIIESPCFYKTKESLKSKQKELKRLGKGSKPNAAHSLSDE